MEIRWNGKARARSGAMTVRALLEILHLTPARVAVPVNRERVPRDQFAMALVRAGDVVEVLRFMAGG